MSRKNLIIILAVVAIAVVVVACVILLSKEQEDESQRPYINGDTILYSPYTIKWVDYDNGDYTADVNGNITMNIEIKVPSDPQLKLAIIIGCFYLYFNNGEIAKIYGSVFYDDYIYLDPGTTHTVELVFDTPYISDLWDNATLQHIYRNEETRMQVYPA